MVVPFYLACVALPFYALSLMLDGVARAYNWIAIGLMPHSLLRPLLILGLIIGFGACRPADQCDDHHAGDRDRDLDHDARPAPGA